MCLFVDRTELSTWVLLWLEALGGLCDQKHSTSRWGSKIVVTDEQLSKEDQQLLVDFGKSHNVVVTRYFSKEIPFGE